MCVFTRVAKRLPLHPKKNKNFVITVAELQIDLLKKKYTENGPWMCSKIVAKRIQGAETKYNVEWRTEGWTTEC